MDLLAARRPVAAGDRLDTLEDPVSVPEAAHTRAETHAVLADIGDLPEAQRTALVLAELGGLSHLEIATVLGRQEGAIRALVHEARRTLVDWRAAREATCATVREQLGTLRGGALRHRRLRRHLEHCPDCRAYGAAIQLRRRRYRLLFPALPSLGLKRVVLGLAGGGSGGLATLSGVATVGCVTCLIAFDPPSTGRPLTAAAPELAKERRPHARVVASPALRARLAHTSRTPAVAPAHPGGRGIPRPIAAPHAPAARPHGAARKPGPSARIPAAQEASLPAAPDTAPTPETQPEAEVTPKPEKTPKPPKPPKAGKPKPEKAPKPKATPEPKAEKAPKPERPPSPKSLPSLKSLPSPKRSRSPRRPRSRRTSRTVSVRPVPSVYVASALGFSAATRPYNDELLAAVHDAGHEPIDPWSNPATADLDTADGTEALRAVNARIAAHNEASLRDCDAVLALLDGTDVDSGVAAEIGFAAALGKPVVGFRLDFRTAGDNAGSTVNLQVEHFPRHRSPPRSPKRSRRSAASSPPDERRERDSNPRTTFLPSHDFQSCPFSRSGTSPSGEQG